jgi:hypothetical protein
MKCSEKIGRWNKLERDNGFSIRQRQNACRGTFINDSSSNNVLGIHDNHLKSNVIGKVRLDICGIKLDRL